MVYIKHYNRIDRQMTEFVFLMLKQLNTKREKKNSLLLTKIYIYTVALIESIYIVFYLYICSFNFLNAPAKYAYCT